MARYFTLPEAEKLLPQVESAIRDAVCLKAEHEQVEEELRATLQRVTMLGGVDLDRRGFLDQRARREAAAARLKDIIERIHGLGCLVKDLDQGLVDFPTLFRDEEVYLCWKLGEKEIGFWHKVEDGFRGRHPIDAAFLDNHKGETPN